MAVDRALFVACAWLLTYALHSTALIGVTWVASGLLSRVAPERAWTPWLREKLWRIALLGGLATATLHAAGIGPWTARVTLASPAVVLSAATVSLAPDLAKDAALLPETPAGPAIPPTWIRVAAAAWAAGVAVSLAAWWIGWRRLRERLRGLEPVRSGEALDRLDRLKERAGIRRTVLLARAPGLAAPITVGILRPVICIPPRAEQDLAPDEIEALLAHELAHAARRDPAWLAFGRALEAVVFFQPLNRLARRRLAEDAELLCDDWAVRQTGDPLPLASCLTEIATWLVGDRVETFAPAMAERGSRLSLRVRRLLDGTGAGAEGRPALFAPASLALLAIPLCVPGVAAQDPEEAPAQVQAFASSAQDEASGLAGEAAALGRDLAALQRELESLRAEIAKLPGTSTMHVRFTSLEAQMLSLRAMRAELMTFFQIDGRGAGAFPPAPAAAIPSTSER